MNQAKSFLNAMATDIFYIYSSFCLHVSLCSETWNIYSLHCTSLKTSYHQSSPFHRAPLYQRLLQQYHWSYKMGLSPSWHQVLCRECGSHFLFCFYLMSRSLFYVNVQCHLHACNFICLLIKSLQVNERVHDDLLFQELWHSLFYA